MKSESDDLQEIPVGVRPQLEDFVIIEILDGKELLQKLSGFYLIFLGLLVIASLVPPPFLEQHHRRPMWSLARPDQTVIATQVTGVTPLNHKIRLGIRFIDHNRSFPPHLGAPIQIFASHNHHFVLEMTSSFPPPISDLVPEDEHSPFHCVFESVLVNFDTCYFRAIVPGPSAEGVEVRWSVIRTFFASFELTFSLSFGTIVFMVVAFRLSRQPRRPVAHWDPQQKMTLNLSICILAYDFLGFIPSLIFPSFFTLAIGEVIRSALRAFVIFYMLFVFNSLLRERKTLKTVVSFPPFGFSILFFAANAVFLVSLVKRDIDFLWPIEYDPKSPIQFFIWVMLAIFFGWLALLSVSIFIIVGNDQRYRLVIMVIVLVPFLLGFVWCEMYVHDLRYFHETAVTYVLCNGGINMFCLITEYLHWPIGHVPMAEHEPTEKE
jgi:hypothetical protein